MAKFLSELKVKCCQENENLWELEDDLIYRSDMMGQLPAYRGLITIPKGFVCDMASTRHIPLVSFIWGSRAHREGILHDYLYRINSVPVVSFAMANAVFIEAMESRDKSFWVRYPMFWGVWLGGYFSYHKKTVEWKPSDKASCDPPDPTDSELVKI